jgi:NAD+ kinase
MPEKLIGLIAHTGKPGAAELVGSLCEALAERGVSVKLEAKTAELVGRESQESVHSLAEQCQLLLVLGGDGTILQVLHDFGDTVCPIFGINLGSLGFLTSVSSNDATQAVEAIAKGSFVLSQRTRLCVEVERDGVLIFKGAGLNDAVISRGELSRLIKLQASINGASLTHYNADGLIISTPTGSTAYSLSAGGPVLAPDSGVFLITPICPHVLTNRSMVVSDASSIEITPAQGQHDVFLTVDGQELHKIKSGDIIRLCKAKQNLPLALLPEMSFFEVLRQKLKWSGSAI